MEKNIKKKQFLFWACAVMAVCVFVFTNAGLVSYAAGEYTVGTSDTLADIQAQVDNGMSLRFPVGTYEYDGALNIGENDTTIFTETGADVTFTPLQDTDGLTVGTAGTVTFDGSGSVTVDGVKSTSGIARGIQCAGNLNIAGGIVNVVNTAGFGVGGDGICNEFNMTGGVLNIDNCGWAGDEGGFIWDKNVCNFTAGELNITNCGNTLFGSIYVECPINFGSDNTSAAMVVNLENNKDSTTENVIVTIKTLTVNMSAVINITLNGSSGQRRGINTDNADVVIDGGQFIVKNDYKGSDATYGIRGANITVENGGILEVTGTSNGVANRMSTGTLTVTGDSLVTMDTTGTSSFDSTEEVNTITGSSVKLQDEYSIVSGQRVNAAADKVSKTPVNAAGEALTRFDLSGKSDSDITIAAEKGNETAHPAYTYSVADDHDNTAYVWAPAVKVNFWPSVNDYAAKVASRIIKTSYTIRGNTIAYVDGSAPSADSVLTAPGTGFFCWIDAATGKKFDPANDVVSADMDVYPALSVTRSENTPIDILEDNGDGSTFINGPRDAEVGGIVYYKMTIDLSSIARVAAYYASSIGYLTGNYTMTVTGDNGIVRTEGAAQSNDITAYFGGPAVQLFELTGTPTYDKATNTLTYSAKVKDKYASDGINGTVLAGLLNGGLYAVSMDDNTATVQKAIKTQGYARTKITFSGNINYSNADYTENYVINMTGTQASAQTLKDPTLGTYGSDPESTVSATVLYKMSRYDVSYEFVSGTSGKTLPNAVTGLLPAASEADDGATVTAVMPEKTIVKVPEGTWMFVGYDAAKKTIDSADILFTGTWVFKADTATSSSSSHESSERSSHSSNSHGSSVAERISESELKTIYDEPVPNTSDISGLAKYAGIMLLSGLACIGFILYKKKKSK